MAIEDILGAVSPAFSIVSGKGPYSDLAKSGMAGVIPQAIARGNDDDKKKKAPGAAPSGQPMKKGGKVSSASKRADGCCVKGKTRGKIV
jgi:hypothetical protein